MVVRKSPGELTLTAEEVNTWGPLLVDADWYASCQALYKASKEKIGKNCTTPTR